MSRALEMALILQAGRMLAPAVNKALQEREDLQSRKVGPAIKSRQSSLSASDYCQGCGEVCVSADLCSECSDYDHSVEPSTDDL